MARRLLPHGWMDETAKLRELLEGFDQAMLVTKCADGSMRARPMYVVRRETGANLWFLTNLGSGKLEELETDPHVNVTMQGDDRFVSLSGEARVTVRREVLEDLWTPVLRPWFPDGVDTADMAAIQVSTREAEYWDRSGWQGWKFAVERLKAVAEGRRPKDDPPERHGHLHDL